MHLKGTKNSPASTFGTLPFPMNSNWWQWKLRLPKQPRLENLPEPLGVGPARPAILRGGSPDWSFVFYKMRSNKWKQGDCPTAVEFRSVNAQLSSLPFCPGSLVGSSQMSPDKLLGHSCPGGCAWALHVMLHIPVSKINCFLGTMIYQLDVFTMH